MGLSVSCSVSTFIFTVLNARQSDCVSPACSADCRGLVMLPRMTGKNLAPRPSKTHFEFSLFYIKCHRLETADYHSFNKCSFPIKQNFTQALLADQGYMIFFFIFTQTNERHHLSLPFPSMPWTSNYFYVSDSVKVTSFKYIGQEHAMVLVLLQFI